MGDIERKTIQWKKLWQLISGIHYATCTETVKEELLKVSKEMQDGILQFKKNVPASSEKLQKLIKDNRQEKLSLFTNKLQQYLDIDALQSWDILCYYLVNEYRGSTNSLTNYISTESNMLKLLNDIWGYYSLERMIMLKIVKHLIEYHQTETHPYAKEYKYVLDKIGMKNLRKSYIEQLELLMNDSTPTKVTPGDIMNSQQKFVLFSERRVLESIEILQTLLLIIKYNGILTSELKKLIQLFKQNSFGKQQQHFNPSNDYHKELVMRLTYTNVAILLVSLYEQQDENWIEQTTHELENQIITLQHFPEHGPILLVWMLFNFRIQNKLDDDDLSSKYRQFGSKALQMNVFKYLNDMISHPLFKDNSMIATVVRKSIYGHLSHLCQLFDADGSVAQHAHIFELLSEILTTPTIANEFCCNEDDPIRSLFQTSIELFPVEFVPLSMIAYSLSSAGINQNNFIREVLENLPVYTEKYNLDKYELRPANDKGDEFILMNNYVPLPKIGFVIPQGTKVTVLDKKFSTFAHFITRFNYFDALHHEINEFLNEIVHYTNLNGDRVKRITYGIKYLAVAVRRIKEPTDISSEMVHPTEMVFDILMKFKAMQSPPIELLSKCFETCTALISLFDTEIFQRIINLNILPNIMNQNLDYIDYSNGHSFESGLVGAYLVNFEKNTGRYPFLMAYLNFIRSYTKLSKNNVYTIEMPGLVFILREIFPHVHTWRFETESERQKIYILILQYFFEILQLTKDQLSDDAPRKKLQKICIYSLLNLNNGLTLLRFVGIGMTQLQAQMENESNWVLSTNSNFNTTVQLSMTILMQILRLKNIVLGESMKFSPLESAIYTQPKQRDTLRIIPVVTSYMNNIFNRRLSILSCRLLKRFAIEFQMSLLACLDMEPDQIRLIFLQRLSDDLESDDFKIAVLEFVEACIETQPGLTEVFFKISYDETKRSLSKYTKTNKNVCEGIVTYMEEFLDAISTDPKNLKSPLLSHIMSIFHALWKKNMQLLIKDVIEKDNFWSSLCNPLFSSIDPHLKAYSQLFNILGIEMFKIFHTKEIDVDLKKVYEKFLSLEVFQRWTENIFALPAINVDDNDESIDVTPEWLCRLQSFKDLLVLLLRKNNAIINFSDKSKHMLAKNCLSVLVERSKYTDDLRPFIILSELYLIILSNYEHKYTETDEEDEDMLREVDELLNRLSASYSEMHKRARDAILSIVIKIIIFQSDKLVADNSLTLNILRSVTDIICSEIYDLESKTKMELKSLSGSTATNQNASCENQQSLLLSVNLLKKIILIYDDRDLPDCWFLQNKLFYRLLSLLNIIAPAFNKQKITIELLELLALFANSNCSREMLFCDIGDYLWLKLLPPKELLQRSYTTLAEQPGKWKSQNWWPIYAKGIELIQILLKKHKHEFFKDAIFFAGIHEEYLMDSILLAKQSLEKNAVVLIKTTLEFVGELVNYEKQWRMEHGQSLLNLMRCIQILMDHAVSLLYRPKILKRLASGVSSNIDELSEANQDEVPDSLILEMNELIEIVILCCKCLLKLSPKIISLICDNEFLPCQWFPLIEIQFGAPKISSDPQLSFGTVMSAACIFTKALNLQQFTFSETPLNKLPLDDMEKDNTDSITNSILAKQAAIINTTSPRTPFSKSLSMSSVTSFASTTVPLAPSNELLSHLDSKLCLTGLEYVMTLLASQSLLALKDFNISVRNKQLIRRELSTELLIFHDFVKKRILKDGKSNLHRKKYGMSPIINTKKKHDDDSEDDEDDISSEDSGSKSSKVARKSSLPKHSMRVSVVRKNHLRSASSATSLENSIFSPISRPGPSTPQAARSSGTNVRGILKPTTSTTYKKVAFDMMSDDSESEINEVDEPRFYEPEDAPELTGLSHIKIVEEDYLHLLSNLFLIISQNES